MSQVNKITKLLWENEVEICSLISDIQQQGFGKKVGYSMFFLETILVAPIKFRAPTKGGDSVSTNIPINSIFLFIFKREGGRF